MSAVVHAPKVAALLAYDARLLSTEGARRVEAHLAGCDGCRRTLAAIRAYDALVDTARAEAPPEPAWERMELALRREARTVAASARDSRQIFAASALAVAAAALLGFGIVAGAPVRATQPTARGDGALPTAPVEPARERIAGEVTLTAGRVTRSGELDVAPGARLDDDSVIATGPGSEADVRFGAATGVAVLASSRVRMARLRRGQVSFDVEDGSVSSEVAHLGAGDLYEVHAGMWTARVRGTRFAVTRLGDDIEVRVAEGVVEVLRGDQLEAVVFAPGVFRSSLGVWTDGDVPRVHFGPEQGEPVTLRADPRIAAWLVDGRRISAASDLRMRAPRGELSVIGLGEDGAELYRRLVPVPVGGAMVEGEALAPSAPAVRAGYLDPELIAPTVRAGIRSMQSCQEQIARLREAPSGRFTLRVTIGRTGEVQRAVLLSDGDPPPAGFAACVVEKTRNWTFPPPTGGIVTFEQPLTFASRLH